MVLWLCLNLGARCGARRQIGSPGAAILEAIAHAWHVPSGLALALNRFAKELIELVRTVPELLCP